MVALFQAGSGFAPFGKIDGREVLGADWGEAGQRGGEGGAAHDQAWRGDLAAGGAPLMVALGAEELLQVVVGCRQPRNLQVVEQAGAVAVGDLEEAVDGIAQGAAGIPAVAPFVEQAGIAGLDVIGRPCSSGCGPRHGPSGSSAECPATARGCAPGLWRAGSAASSIPLAGAPLFLDAAEAGLDRLQAVVQPQARSLERWSAVVGQGATHRRTVTLHDLRLRVGSALNPALDRPNPAHRLLQLFLGMPVGLKDRQ